MEFVFRNMLIVFSSVLLMPLRWQIRSSKQRTPRVWAWFTLLHPLQHFKWLPNSEHLIRPWLFPGRHQPTLKQFPVSPTSCYHTQPEQIYPPARPAAIPNSSMGLALKGKTWPKKATLSTSILYRAQDAKESCQRQQLHLSSCYLNTSWLAKTTRKTRSFKLQLCQKSQIRKGHSILHSYFQSTSEVKW